jgi:hypothetical protein
MINMTETERELEVEGMEERDRIIQTRHFHGFILNPADGA